MFFTSFKVCESCGSVCFFTSGFLIFMLPVKSKSLPKCCSKACMQTFCIEFIKGSVGFLKLNVNPALFPSIQISSTIPIETIS